jgi:hypothetical protein
MSGSPLDLPDNEAAALLRELDRIIGDDRYPLSPRIRTLRAIRAKLRPEPAREPLPTPTRVKSEPDSPMTLVEANIILRKTP